MTTSRHIKIKLAFVVVAIVVLLVTTLTSPGWDTSPPPNSITQGFLAEVVDNHHQPSARRAVVTSLYSDSYVDGVRVLGHSLKQHKTGGDMVMIYIAGQVSDHSLCLAREVGWVPRAVDRIAPLEGTAHQYRDQYTKLRIWELDGYHKVVYLDADTLVVGDINDLFLVPHDFAAVPDTYEKENVIGFNAGVLVIRPSRETFTYLMGNLSTTDFVRSSAEQSYLREYYKADVMLLPYKYNLNLAQIYHPPMWNKVWEDARVVHYTLKKPFLGDHELWREQIAMWHRVNDSLAAISDRASCG